MRKLFTLTLALLASFSLWADPTVEILNSNFTQWATTPPENSGLSNKNTYTITDGVSNVATVVGSGCKLNDTKNKPTSTGITGYNTNKFRFGSSGNYLYITPVANFIEGGKIRLLISAERTSESDILGTVYIGESHNLGNIHGWTAKATCDWQEFDIPASVTGTTAEIRITRTDNTLFLWGIQVLTNEDCIDSESTIKGDTTLYVNNGYNIGFNSINTNGCTIDVKKNGAAAVDDVDYSKININNYTFLKAGEFVITISQAKDANNHCAVEESVTVTVLDATPVAAVTVEGETNAYVGAELTYTATAENATAYEWYLDDVKQGSDSTKFIYTAVKGNHTIVCKARNTFNLDPEWISSDEKALTVTNPSGTLIAATAETSGSNIDKNITATGVIGGTVHQKTQKNAKLGSEGHYFSLTLASGSFQDGDTVKVVVTPEYNKDKDTYSAPSQLKISTTVGNTNLIGESETKTIDPASDDDLYFDIVLTEGASTIYLARDGSICKQNPIVKSIAVVRPKEVKSVTETLSNVKIDGVAISSANLTTLLANESLDIAESYLNAPEVKFYKTIRTTYEDDTYSDKLDSIVVTSTTEAGKWQAQATINEVEYTITMGKQASFTVIYMDGATKLGEENVAANGHPAEYATYESRQLATFDGWYDNVGLTGDAIDLSAATITEDITYFAKFTYVYAESINIEQFALNNEKSETNTNTLLSQLGTKHYATGIVYSEGTNEIDVLDNSKKDSLRNYAYLGLKVKTAGAMINFRLAEGSTVKVKFGNIGKTPKVSINGAEYSDMTIDEKVYTYTATGEDLISIKTADGNAVVFKQIAIDEPLANVMYGISYADADNGEIGGWKIAIPGETVKVYPKPADGYKVASVTINGEPLAAVDGKYSFEMPSAAVEVVAVFSVATALDNTADEIKAVKFVENGQLFIRRGEKVYTITGEEVK